jgi:hypothetical protein
MTKDFIVDNPLQHVKSPRLKRGKGNRHLLPKLRFSNNVEERHIPYNKDNNYQTPLNFYSGRKGFRGKHRESINVNLTNKRHITPGLSENEISKYRKNTLRKLQNKKNLFLNGGTVEKTNPLIEKKLENLYDQRKDFVKTLKIGNRKNLSKLDTLNLKIKEYVKNGYRGLRGSTRKIMTNFSKNLRV